MKRLLTVAFAIGCSGGDPGPSCAEVASAMAGDTPLRDVIAERCHVDVWPRAVRGCLVELGVRLDSDKCLRHLPAKHRVALAEQIAKTPTEVVVEKRDGALRAALPATGNTELDPDVESLVVEVTADSVTINGKQFSDDQLANLFRAAYARDHKAQVILKADTSSLHGRIVKLMELAKEAGLQRVAIGTRP